MSSDGPFSHLLTGRRGSFAALLAGTLVTISLAPFNLWPLGILACFILMAALDGVNRRTAVWRGYLFGLGMFGSGTSWVYVSINVYGQAPPPLAALLVALFVAGLAGFIALVAWLYHRYSNDAVGRWLAFPLLWVGGEWLRCWFLSGFPWLFLGYAHLRTPLSNLAPVVGVLGISAAVAFTAAGLYTACYQRPTLRRLALLSVFTLWLAAELLGHWDQVTRTSQTLQVSLVQPNISQHDKWNPAAYPDIMATMQQLTAAAAPGTQVVIWPEAAIPRLYHRARPELNQLQQIASDNGYTIITGIPTLIRNEGKIDYYNSAISLGDQDRWYHKQQLVPFGEYVPLEGLLRGLIEFFDLPMSNFSPGPANQEPLLVDGIKLAPSICYEIAYGAQVAKTAAGADILLTLSNDAWFGGSIGPLQHFQMARMRALENGRYLIRATNNGISAIINHHGKVVVAGEQFSRELIEGKAHLVSGTTLYSRWGDWPILSTGALLLILLLIRRRYADT